MIGDVIRETLRLLGIAFVRLVALAAVGVALLWGIYVVLERDGQFSPTKCVQQGGKWDEAVELCNKDR